MKKLTLIAIAILAFSCKKESQEPFGKPTETATVVQTPEALGKEIFEGKGNCVACHQVDQKVIGPSIKEIANELGFDDEFYFSRYFKNHVNVSPKVFREKVGISIVAK